MNEPNIQCVGTRVARVTYDADFGVFSESTNGHPPQFIEIGLKDGNVLKIYADGTHSDNEEFKFVEYQAPSNFPARKWLFEQFFEGHYPCLWQVYRFVRKYHRTRGRLLIWWLNKREKDPNVRYL